MDLSASAAGAASYCVARTGPLPVFVNSFIGTRPHLFIDLWSVAAFPNNCRVKETGTVCPSNPDFCSVDWPSLDVSHKWIHVICSLSNLVCFIRHNVFAIHLM